jgi:hypothetical protein
VPKRPVAGVAGGGDARPAGEAPDKVEEFPLTLLLLLLLLLLLVPPLRALRPDTLRFVRSSSDVVRL